MTSAGGAGPAGEGVSLGLTRRIADWIGAWQRGVSDRAHADGDARARARGLDRHRQHQPARVRRPRLPGSALRQPTAPRPSGWPGAAGRTPGSASAPGCAAPLPPQ